VKVVSIVGARPQFIKAAPVSRALLVHIGQHYDGSISRIFFDNPGIPRRGVYLYPKTDSSSHTCRSVHCEPWRRRNLT